MGFKRNSSRFGGNGGNSGGSDRGSSRGGDREERNNDRGSDRGGRSGGGNGGKKYAFTRLGSLTVPKSAEDDIRDLVLDELKGSEIRLNLTIYPPKGVESVKLNRGDIICISFKTGDKDPEFVVGNASVPNND